MFYLTNVKGAEADAAIIEQLQLQQRGHIYLWSTDKTAMRVRNRIYQLRNRTGVKAHVMLDDREPYMLAVVTYGKSFMECEALSTGKIV